MSKRFPSPTGQAKNGKRVKEKRLDKRVEETQKKTPTTPNKTSNANNAGPRKARQAPPANEKKRRARQAATAATPANDEHDKQRQQMQTTPGTTSNASKGKKNDKQDKECQMTLGNLKKLQTHGPKNFKKHPKTTPKHDKVLQNPCKIQAKFMQNLYKNDMRGGGA